jgi:hypothetical protein
MGIKVSEVKHINARTKVSVEDCENGFIRIASIITNDIKTSLSSSSEETAAYLLALVSLVVILIINKVLGSNSLSSLYWITLIILLYGFMTYVKAIVLPIWGSVLGKLLISIGGVIGTTLSLSFANLLINSSLQVPSSPFIYTQTLLSLLIAPLVISLIFGVLGMFVFPFTLILFSSAKINLSAKNVLTFWMQPRVKHEMISGVTLLSRIIAMTCLLTLSWSFNGDNRWYTNQLDAFTKWYALNFEMEKYSHCKLGEGERISYINKTAIIVGVVQDNSYEFKTSVCEYLE